ncbi:helix-turn-helix domain-containing protein [Micromonospora yangpuensis]|uniref:Helix-turn-helix domain-containing protein n=1 Tax=Micromonospora yangpuensis TaxID=683228 RepID=A0A1C6UMH6_9ACTN|nr:helix-turn-helix transcriptional regulator [Micromonospora yangpuensis]GGM27840.1 transcriptional regulator [Micromonospora yangpuensis]SCL55211.1 Helix-turn-helix domain-containing protein [Micromonospora yangpuensis]
MATDLGSSVPRRHLGNILRELRTEARMTLDGVSQAIGCSRQKIWQLEAGLRPVRPLDVRTLTTLYAANPDLATNLTTLATETTARGWWHAYDNPVPATFTPYPSLEATAARIRTYHESLIPGLLQTAAYTRAAHPHRPDDPDVRRQRTDLLTRRLPPPPRLHAVLSEAVLLRPAGGPDVMAAQLAHLLTLAETPTVTIQVLPLTAGATAATLAGPFTILDFAPGNRTTPDPPVIHRELLTGALYLDRPEEIAAYERVWTKLTTRALDPEASTHLIDKHRHHLDDGR